MRTLVLGTAASLLLSLSGCQQLPLLKAPISDHPTLQAQATAPSRALHGTHRLTQLWTQQFGQASIQDYPAACLAHSRLSQPMVIGQVIDTPRYAMITLAKKQQQTEVMGGELCILNKVSHHIEITAVDDLRFITPITPSVNATQMP